MGVQIMVDNIMYAVALPGQFDVQVAHDKPHQVMTATLEYAARKAGVRKVQPPAASPAAVRPAVPPQTPNSAATTSTLLASQFLPPVGPCVDTLH